MHLLGRSKRQLPLPYQASQGTFILYYSGGYSSGIRTELQDRGDDQTFDDFKTVKTQSP